MERVSDCQSPEHASANQNVAITIPREKPEKVFAAVSRQAKAELNRAKELWIPNKLTV